RGLFVDQVDGVFALEDDDSKRVALSAGARGGRGQSCGTCEADDGPEHGASNGLLTRAPGTRSTMRTARTPTTTTQPAPGGLGEDVRDLESRGVTFTRGDAATTRGASASRLRILAAAPTAIKSRCDLFSRFAAAGRAQPRAEAHAAVQPS